MNDFNWELVEYLFSFIESALFFYFLSITLKKKEDINNFFYILFVGLYFIINSFLTKNIPFSNSKLIVIVLIALIFVICMYKETLKNKIIFTVVFFMVLVLCDVLTANILKITMRINLQEVLFTEKWFRVFLFCISKVILILTLRVISHYISSDNINVPSKYWYMIISTFIVSLVILMVIGEIGILTPYYYNKPAYFIISCIGILMINIFVQYIFIQLSKYYEKEQLYNIISIRNKMIEKYYIEKDQVYRETRKLGHDFKNHILCIRALIDSNKIDEAKKYIEGISETVTIHTTLINSGNDIVDAILSQKLGEAQNSHIHMDITATAPKEIQIKSIDLCAILANIIDNAIEAAEKINDANKRLVKVNINPYKDYLFISVSNISESNPLKNINKFRSTKIDSKNHGLGVKIIRNAVEKYNGSMEYTYENSTLTLKILLKLK